MRRPIVALLLLALAASCGDSTNTTAPTSSIAGNFSLTTVNGSPLPYLGMDDPHSRYEVLQDIYTLNDSRTWSEVYKYRFTDKVAGTSVVKEYIDAGTYTRSGSDIHLVSENTDISGTFDGTSISFVLQGQLVLVYRR